MAGGGKPGGGKPGGGDGGYCDEVCDGPEPKADCAHQLAFRVHACVRLDLFDLMISTLHCKVIVSAHGCCKKSNRLQVNSSTPPPSLSMSSLHQVWFDLGKGADPPEPNGIASMKRTSGLPHRLWSMADADRLVSEQTPHLRRIWDGLPHGINRADFFRYVVMYVEGGAYFDVDFTCTQSIEPLLVEHVVVLGEEWPFSSRTGTVHNGALVCKTRYHPFWTHVFDEVDRRLRLLGPEDHVDQQKSVFCLTGTAMLRDVAVAYLASPRTAAIVVAPFGLFCPLLIGSDYVDDYAAAGDARGGAYRFPVRPRTGAHTFCYIAPSPLLWQSDFYSTRAHG